MSRRSPETPETGRALVEELITLVDALVSERLEAAMHGLRRTGEDFPYTQHERPWWAPTKGAFLRGWRELEAEKHPGVRKAGKLRAMSETASEAYASRKGQTRPALSAPASTPRSVEEDVFEELGLRPVRRAS